MRNPNRETVFHFKQFDICNRLSAMKVGTDGVLLGAWCVGGQTMLDIGCGSGLIALMLAQRFPTGDITGVEIDPVAASEATSNFHNSPWKDRLSIIQGDITTVYDTLPKGEYDAIVCNPPFFVTGKQSDDTNRSQARHESTLTLTALLKVSNGLLTPTGTISLILPAEREKELEYLAIVHKLSLVRICTVSTVPTKPPRRIMAELSPATGKPLIRQHICLHDTSGNLSEEYATLVQDFYLHL